MKKSASVCLALLSVLSTLSFSQVKYDSGGDFGIGTDNPRYLLHLKEADPVMILESTIDHDNTIRLCEGPTSWRGAYIRYDGGLNKLLIGAHSPYGTSTSDDKNVLTIDRNSGQIELNPISTTYNFQSFVTNAPNYETQCYNVKLGSSNNFWVDGDGDVWHSGLHTISDLSLKENILDLSSSLDIINQLRPVKYNFKEGAFGEKMGSSSANKDKIRYGLIAQEVELVLPSLVESRGDSLKAINYVEIIPLLIDAIQIQQEEIEGLMAQISDSPAYKSAIAQTSSNDLEGLSSAVLFQNTPNPFNENTTVKYSIPSFESYALINVYNLQGNQIKSVEISNTGDGEIVIPVSELYPGLFIYNLIVDGYEVESKRMVITEF